MFSHLPLVLLVGVIIDAVINDPPRLYHPVQAVAALAKRSEQVIRPIFPNREKVAGVLYVITTLTVVVGVLSAVYYLFFILHPVLPLLFSIYLTASLLAYGSMVRELSAVRKALLQDDLDAARIRTQGLVSRDLSKANREQIIAAALESGAENSSDGIVAPLFYFAFGGPILMAVYKVINTLDSLVGYKNERYRLFGSAAARLDDGANYLPARLTGLLIILVATILGDRPRSAWQAWQQDAQKGPSPNGGIPITAFAGARNIRLGNISVEDSKHFSIPAVGGSDEPSLDDIRSLIIYLGLLTTVTAVLVLVCQTALFLSVRSLL